VRRVTQRRLFRRDIKRQKRRGKDIEKLIAVVGMLAKQGVLPRRLRPHRLSGDWGGIWECHVGPDWLLVYDITDEEVLLIRTGSHADLFR
jgi:mRNA interferase YafQ